MENESKENGIKYNRTENGIKQQHKTAQDRKSSGKAKVTEKLERSIRDTRGQDRTRLLLVPLNLVF